MPNPASRPSASAASVRGRIALRTAQLVPLGEFARTTEQSGEGIAIQPPHHAAELIPGLIVPSYFRDVFVGSLAGMESEQPPLVQFQHQADEVGLDRMGVTPFGRQALG